MADSDPLDNSSYSLKPFDQKDVEDKGEGRILSLDEAFDEIDYGDFHSHVIILVGLTHACESIPKVDPKCRN